MVHSFSHAFTLSSGVVPFQKGSGFSGSKLHVLRTRLFVPVSQRLASIYHIKAALNPEGAESFNSSQLSAVPSSDRARVDSVRELLEFWLSDINLRHDWYLRRQFHNDGSLDPSVFLTFNRLKRLNASLEEIIQAAKISADMEVFSSSSSSDDNVAQLRIRRSQSLPDFSERDDSELECSIRLKCIPHNSTVNSLISLFKPYGEVTYVQVYRDKYFGLASGALICFPSKDVTDRVYETFSNDAPLAACGIILRRRHLPAGSEGSQTIANNLSSSGGNVSVLIFHVTGIRNDLDWRYLHQTVDDVVLARSGRHVRHMLYEVGSTDCYLSILDSPSVRDMLSSFREKELVIAGSTVQVKLLEDEDEIEAYKETAKEYQEKQRKRREQRFASRSTDRGDRKPPSNVIIKLSGLNSRLTWRLIMAELKPHGEVIFLQRERGDDTCYLRMKSPEEANALCDKLTGEDPVMIAGDKVSAYILNGEEEDKYWERAEESKRQRKAKFQEVESEKPVTT